MSERAAQRIRMALGICLAVATMLAIRMPLLGAREQYPNNVIFIGTWVLCAAAAGGLLARKAAGFWMLYAATAWGLMFGAQISYLPLVLTFTPERLRIGVLAFVNLALTVLAFCAHMRLRRREF